MTARFLPANDPVISTKFGCSVYLLNEWTKRSDVDTGALAGVPTEAVDKVKSLEWDQRDLR
ncbi:hypothetical protein [Roseibium polysiphoniae]|uniref:hypothetical protein n=1 Tax=Roseibium polysiphoniae TaxID=2571221 RepID=UPI001BCF4BE6|nr:hypothetical protein [Roseibium polysiphoniae]